MICKIARESKFIYAHKLPFLADHAKQRQDMCRFNDINQLVPGERKLIKVRSEDDNNQIGQIMQPSETRQLRPKAVPPRPCVAILSKN